MTFGQAFQQKRIEQGKSMRKVSTMADIAAPYLSDIEYGKRAAPENEVLDRLIKALELSIDEERYFYDLAAKERNSIAQDIPNYIKENEIVIEALRTAKDANAGLEEWQNFIEEMRKKSKKGQ